LRMRRCRRSPVEGIGLKNTRERLANLYGDDAHFSVTAMNDGVLAVLDLPYTAVA
jgi:sensor histidine kinase YesM